MKITVIQMQSGSEKAANIAAAQSLVERAVWEDQPHLVVLPETWACIGGDMETKLREAEILPADAGDAAGPAYTAMREMAQQYGVTLHGGSIHERVGDRLFNTTVVFSPQGEEIARYRKIHLFDAETLDGVGYRESDEYGAGSELVTYEMDGLTVGCAICYDLRFPEQFLALRRAGVELIVLPSAFTLQTGRDHWEVLLRARAIDTQCWIAAAAMWGSHLDAEGQNRYTFGHSLLVDPWGQVVCCAPDGTGWVTGSLESARTEQIRAAMPVMRHRTVLDYTSPDVRRDKVPQG
ncbi:MAG TPA: carbon-nitrogen hydrolase family protein [Acidobacteriaceae bacterium]|jgi:nitrilase